MPTAPQMHITEAETPMKPTRLARAVRWLCLVLVVQLSCSAALADDSLPAQPPHPLDPVIAWAEGTLKRAEAIKDYTARLVKRERVGDDLQDYQYLDVKVRHEPFSVYVKFLKPSSLAGREIIYVDGQNDGNLLAHDTSALSEILGTVSLAPDGRFAMHGQRYPITMIGFKNLASRLIEEAKRDRENNAPVDIKWFKNAKVDGRTTVCIEVSHPERRPEQTFAMARVYVDQQLGIPIRYEGYTWPEMPGEKPVLVEEYTYSCIQTNVGLSDRDFDPKNPAYRFQPQ